ncbi:hypothetical protein MTO96_025110 [Rhipicephalus appendiculatus]
MVDGGYFTLPVAVIEGVEVQPIILCNQAFPRMTNLIKPFLNALPNTEKATFNYNLSRTRRIVENTFGRLKARFRYPAARNRESQPYRRLGSAQVGVAVGLLVVVGRCFVGGVAAGCLGVGCCFAEPP